MGFRPNMTPGEVYEEDRKRGHGDMNPFSPEGVSEPPALKAMDEYNDTDETDDLAMEEEQSADSNNEDEADAEEDMELSYNPDNPQNFGKPLPEKKKRKDESEFQQKIRQWSDEVEDRPKRFPGGKKQAVAIAAQQAGVSKSLTASATDMLKSTAQAYPGLDQKLETPGIAKTKKTTGLVNDEYEKDLMDKMPGENMSKPDTTKALNSRSMAILPPRGKYDPFQIQRSATAQMTRLNSGLRGPDGVAPLVGETLDEVHQAEARRTHGETYKSCNTHGITYRASLGCHPCNIVKSMTCKSCGGDMTKRIGGEYACKACGE